MTHADRIVAILQRAGVRRLFGMPGGGSNADLIEAAGRAGMPFSLAHTETAAAFMALALGGPAGIDRVHIETYGPGYEIVKEMNPRSPYQAKFSIAYCVAAALAEGRVGLDQFSTDRFGPEGVRVGAIADLLRRTRVTMEDDLTAKYPAAWPARLNVTLADGTVLRGWLQGRHDTIELQWHPPCWRQDPYDASTSTCGRRVLRP